MDYQLVHTTQYLIFEENVETWKIFFFNYHGKTDDRTDQAGCEHNCTISRHEYDDRHPTGKSLAYLNISLDFRTFQNIMAIEIVRISMNPGRGGEGSE